MEDAETEESEIKNPHLDPTSASSSSPTAKANPRTSAASSSSSSDNRSVDASVLHYENQKLVQKLDSQKQELQELEGKIKALREKQASYDDSLIKVNQLWNELVDDLILLEVRAGGTRPLSESLQRVDHIRGLVPSCAPEDTFLCRLLEEGSFSSNSITEITKNVEDGLASRQSSTLDLIKVLEDTIKAERLKCRNIEQRLQALTSAEDTVTLLSDINSMIKQEVEILSEAVDVLHRKQKDFSNCIQSYITCQSKDEAEIKRLEGEIEESLIELEESRRKLVHLRMQMDASGGFQYSSSGPTNGSASPEKPSDKMICLRDLKDSIEETKNLAADRLSELQDAQEYKYELLKQLQDLQSLLKDDEHVLSSRCYTLLNDQLQHTNAEVARYKALSESLQADRLFVMRREKELIAKLEAADAAKVAYMSVDSKVVGLEQQLEKCIAEKNDLEIKLEEAIQDSGRKDIKAEFRVMASALSREMGMMEMQLNRWRHIADEVRSLHEETQMLKASLASKCDEHISLTDSSNGQLAVIESLKAQIEKLEDEKVELQVFLDMYTIENESLRDVAEIRESEQKARSQAIVMRNALEEHSLQLRIKAAKEAEAACQRRLYAAEAEIEELQAKLDASEREVAELDEAVKLKDAEAETYISEIETIGQAYEDMQTQNQHLLQQVTERDDYNIKLVSDSVKAKQAHNSLLSEKQELMKELQLVNSSLDSLRSKFTFDEEQLKFLRAEGMKFSQEDRHLQVILEATRIELADAEKELKWLKSAFASTEKEYNQLETDTKELQMKLDSERDIRRKIEEEIVEYNRQVAELTAESGEATIKRLQDEINDCRTILKCSVCLDRPKEVVIVKCFHLFCNQCIQRNLEIRHRKCPGCGTAFGQNDVRLVKI
ncbi:hypothetical protein MLD38_040310 [Melastoma candidum]|uniref:Uncharacterized protein n=1 Tax=Melastoma candidum TaxID=119954 RepID=A0ACB9L5C4_9MYRT|nr:hypothetical protein MLD38_040310 [Melastoma candidum]